MDKRTFVGLCAALAFVAGSPGAYALKIFDSAPDDRMGVMEGDDSFTYAAETLMTNMVQEVEGDSTTYYNISGTAGPLVLSAPADIGATAGDVYVVVITLDGMVFRDAQLLDRALTGGTFEVATGGAPGDKLVVYRLTSEGVDAAEGVLSLTAQFAVSEEGGSATLTMTNQTLAGLNIEGVSGRKAHSGNVIKVASALKETTMANDLIAEVVSSFKKFKGGMTIGNLGSLTVEVEPRHRMAINGSDVVNLEEILLNETDDGVADSSVSFMGDFSFASSVFVHGDANCGTAGVAGMDIRIMEGEGDDAVVTDTTMAVSLDANGTTNTAENTSWMNYLCIMVQGDDTDDMDAPRIPDTSAYTATGSYKALDMAADGPMGVERILGAITRDGTTVRFPYLTTREGYVQRIRIVNRGGEAKYTLDYATNAEAVAGTDEGVLEPGERKVLVVSDVVEITGSTTTAGTLIVEAEPRTIDVATTVNTADGGIDTVVYPSD
jgi:hypothetical protein